MTKNYFDEYNCYIEDLQHKLMKIQLRFNNCINTIRSDLNKGIITPEQGEYYLKQRMDKYYEDIPSQYRLAKTDVDFVKTYADVDRDGQLLSTFLKREYLDKKDKLNAILESVRIFGYLDSISKEDARLTVKKALNEYYLPQLKNIENKMNALIQMHGDNVKHSRRYLELKEDKEKLQQALQAFSNLEKAPEDIFQKIVSQFYKIQRKYYDWYLKMQIKQEYEQGTIYQEHYELMERMDNTGRNVLTASDELTTLNKNLEDTNKAFFSILSGISEFDITNAVNSVSKQKKKLFKKEENNKEGLFNAFINLMSIYGIKSYIEEMYGNKNNSISLNKVFEDYWKDKYGEDILYVDPLVFLNDLGNDIIIYYKEKIADILHQINVLNIKINSNTTLLCDNIKLGINQADLERQIRIQYPAKKDELLIPGFTTEELERIYTDLKEYIGNGFSFGTDGEISLRKV